MDEATMYHPVRAGEVYGVPQVPGLAIAVADVNGGRAIFHAYQVSGQVWHDGQYRVEDDQFEEYLGEAEGPALIGGALDFLAMVVIRLREIAAESN